jgi:hypothetical protein
LQDELKTKAEARKWAKQRIARNPAKPSEHLAKP